VKTLSDFFRREHRRRPSRHLSLSRTNLLADYALFVFVVVLSHPSLPTVTVDVSCEATVSDDKEFRIKPSGVVQVDLAAGMFVIVLTCLCSFPVP
jgi:hypothetical protein